MKEIYSLKCPKRDCDEISPLIYEKDDSEIFYCPKHKEFRIDESGAIFWKEERIKRIIVWKEMGVYKL